MKKSIAFICGCMAFGIANAATPDIVIKSDLYQTYGATNAFTLYLGAAYGCEGYVDVVSDNGNQTEAEVAVAYFDSDNQEFVGTSVSCQVGPEGWIEIYCDEGVVIDYVSIAGGGVTSIDFAKPEAMSILELEHNSLGSLDLTSLTNLGMLSVKDNPFDVAPLSVKGEYPNMVILDITQVENIDPDFDIVSFPNLRSFDAMSTHGLMKLTPSACPALQKISVDNTSISSLDVTKNAGLYILNISETAISEIDLTACPLLQQFYAQHESSYNDGVKLKSLDVSKNPDLIYLFVTGNDFESIDISNNKYLTDLFARKNQLKQLDLTNNPNLLNVFISANNMDFNSLPLVSDAWLDYDFTQRDIKLPRSCKVGAPIDVRSQVVLSRTDISEDDRQATTAILYSVDPKDINNLTEIDSDYYTFDDGILTVNKVVADSVIAVFSNPLFPATALRTSQFLVKDEEAYGKREVYITMDNSLSVGSPVMLSIGLEDASVENPRPLYVDFGDGALVEYTVTDAGIPSSPNVIGELAAAGSIKVYLDDTERISAFKITDLALDALDITPLKELRQLEVVNAGLNDIDLSWNRCLTSLVLNGNHFADRLSLAGVSGDYGKNVLSRIVLSNNDMTAAELFSDPFGVKYLDLSGNKLTELNFKDYDNLQYLNVSDNALTELVINYCSSLTECDASANQLSAITLPEENNLTILNISDNKFDFATLPQQWSETVDYIYAPQKQLKIAEKGPGCDIAAYLSVVDDVATTYTWKTEDGLTLTEGTDYTIEEQYVKFSADMVGKNVYCELANTLFPALAGANALCTTAMSVNDRPDVEILSFVSSKSQTVKLLFMADKDNSSVYIDWNGSGELQQCFLPEAGGRYEFSGRCSTAGKVRVYAYNSDVPVTFFRVTDATIRDLDFSGMKHLNGLRITNCGLTDTSVKAWPSSPLAELYLENNKYTTFDFSAFPALANISFTGNSLASVDISMLSELQTASFSKNNLTSITLGNPKLWSLDLSLNNLSDIDFAGIPAMYQLFLNENDFARFDLDKLYALSDLRVLYVDKNKLDFTTLPVPQPNWNVYVYRNQPTLEVEPVDGIVDLSSQASRDGVETQFVWFYGYPEYDSNTGEISGEALVEGEQYTVENGVTTFMVTLDKVCGVLLNSLFPNAYLQTNLFSVAASGIPTLSTDELGNAVIYNLQGMKVSASALIPGIYIVNGKKLMLK